MLPKEYKKELLQSIAISHNNYFLYGPRSTKKIEPIHQTIAQHLYDNKLNVHSKGIGDNKEIKVPGKLYNKNCDITIYDNNMKPAEVIELKFITTNYKQNANNYFESLLGATSNLQRNNIKVSQFIILPQQLPYLDKNSRIKKLEIITNSDVDKYRKLMDDSSDSSTPTNLCFILLDLWNNTIISDHINNYDYTNNNIVINDHNNNINLSKENKKFLSEHGDYDSFLQKIIN